MKNQLLKIFGRITGIASIMVLGLALSSSIAHAGWNDAPSGECDTFSIANISQSIQTNANGCWTTTNVSANVGDVINVKVYFHNNTNTTVSDVKVKVTPNDGQSGNVYSAGTIYANGSAVASGFGRISLPSGTELVYKKTVVQYQRTGYNVEDKGATQVVFESGLQVGPIRGVNTDPSWGDQGLVKVVYVVESTGTTPVYQCNDGIDNDGDGLIDMQDSGCTSPTDDLEQTKNGILTVITNNYSSMTSDGDITFQGSYSGNNGGSINTCFTYRKLGQVGTTVSGNYSGSATMNNFSKTVYALSPGDYQYSACVTTSNGTQIYGAWKNFTIPGNGGSTYQCNDGVDNDNDGYVDMQDSGCSSSTDDSEFTTADTIINVTTNSPSALSSNGNVTFEGSYTGNNGGSVTTCFMYRKDGQDTNTTFGNYSGSATNASFSKTILGLSAGDYQYRACVNDNQGNQIYGSWRSFTIPDDNGTISEAYVDTLDYRNLDGDRGRVTFVGRYYGVESGVVSTYFSYRKIGSSTRETSETSYYNTSREFSHSISGLSEGNYEYKACIINRGNSRCGSWVDFRINDDGDIDNEERPAVTTLSPFQVSYDFVTMDGYYNMNGCSGTTYFEYGRSNNLGERTNSVSRSQSGSMAQSISGLSAQTTYYYRAVANNCAGTTYGAIRSFTTTNRVVDNNTIIIRPPTNNTTTIIGGNNNNQVVVGSGARYIRLTIDNGRDTVARGDELVYEVNWENISNVDLRDLVLEVSIPEALQIISAGKGQIDKKANTIYVNIDELRANERDDMDVRVIVRGPLQSNESVTARAIIAFENPEIRSQENAIAYDSDSYIANQNVLGASIFGLDFLPGTLAGWLFIILLIVLLILLIRYATGRMEQRNNFYGYGHGHGGPTDPVPPAPVENPTNDYTPYRPTPKS